MNRWALTWFPELGRVGSTTDRWGLWRAAYKPVLKSPSYLLIAVATQVGAQIAIVVPASRYARSHGVSGPLVTWGLTITAALFACLVIIWLVRRRITGNLRRLLTERGSPTCLICGYDLTGNTSGVCPECGRRFR